MRLVWFNNYDEVIKIKARTKFMKMFYKLPKPARRELIYGYSGNPMSLNVVAIEVSQNTDLGRSILTCLGYEDDKNEYGKQY